MKTIVVGLVCTVFLFVAEFVVLFLWHWRKVRNAREAAHMAIEDMGR